MASKEEQKIEKFFGDNGYTYCEASEAHYKALEDAGYEFHRGHSKSHVGDKSYFIEISKETGLRVVISHCEKIDFKATKITFNKDNATWEKAS